ncbi:hypothetical protein L3Q82_006687 [Scortum barcoo]|uniref:Uncharacterized protein n=1 Tax=Scortum barcoo TaxID=214431 RepID=A0ACB8WYX2_9TELE|nr:hypothetical protein L3Q82_006687 [Scortum barcoo]
MEPVSPCSSALTRENIDLNRVPQVIHEASCHTSHSCRGLDNAFGLETIPVSLRMPVLKKNPSCFPTTSYSLEFELITIACAQGEPTLVCEKYRAPVADLQILVFFSKCQSSSTVLGSEHRAHYRTSGPQATFMKSVPDCLGRDIHTSGPLEKY